MVCVSVCVEVWGWGCVSGCHLGVGCSATISLANCVSSCNNDDNRSGSLFMYAVSSAGVAGGGEGVGPVDAPPGGLAPAPAAAPFFLSPEIGRAAAVVVVVGGITSRPTIPRGC